MDEILPIKVDLICSWPVHLYYPWFINYLRRERNRFAKVICVFTEMNTPRNYRNFIEESMKGSNIIFTLNDKVQAKDDWRNLAVNKGLQYSDSPWVLFTEQDFIIDNPELFWETTWKHIITRNLDAFVYLEGNRPHPAFWLVKREFIDKTSKNFSVKPNISDHFSIFDEELRKTIAHVGYFYPREDFHHLNGLSQNMYLLQSGQEPNYRIDDFKQYLKDCLALDIPQEPETVELIKNYLHL